jgi:protein-S-isoprenylcysteine O-methyltransferase Ste14
MGQALQLLGWLICIIYSTIPVFWMMIHPFADRWRARRRSGYFMLLPAWWTLWVAVALLTKPWRTLLLYRQGWLWAPAALLFFAGLFLYSRSGENFTAKQLGGLPEIHSGNNQQHLITTGIRSRIRHPIYLAHLCEMLAWSIGTGLAVCWGLTAFAAVTGAVMIRMEDSELEKRFANDYLEYRRRVPALLPRLKNV